MPVIDKPQSAVPLINLFRVEAVWQHEFLALQIEQTRRFRVHMRGFISSTFHRGLDGTRILNYALWEGAEDVARARQSAAFRGHLGQLDRFEYSNDMHLYRAVAVLSGGAPPVTETGGRAGIAIMSTTAGRQARVAKSLAKGLGAALREGRAAGLLSASVLGSLDGERVAVYLQWNRTALPGDASGSGLAELGIALPPGALVLDDGLYEVADTSVADTSVADTSGAAEPGA